MSLTFGYYENGPCCTQIAQILQHNTCTLFSIITYLLNIPKCFPQLFTACLKPKFFTHHLLPHQSPNSKHSHTCYCRIAHNWCITGIVFSSILFTKRKRHSICFSIQSFKPIDQNSKAFKGIPQIFFLFAACFY